MFYSSRAQMAESIHQYNGGGTCHMRHDERNNPPFSHLPPSLVTAAVGGQSMRRKEAKEFIGHNLYGSLLAWGHHGYRASSRYG